ncbi:hypothetical protein CR513_60939, partial [Mucuna pruriens]
RPQKICVITLVELLPALQQIRLVRQEVSMEVARDYGNEIMEIVTKTIIIKYFHHIFIARKKKENFSSTKRYWWRPSTKCYKCGQLRYMEKIYKSHQHPGEANVEDK